MRFYFIKNSLSPKKLNNLSLLSDVTFETLNFRLINVNNLSLLSDEILFQKEFSKSEKAF